MRIGIGIGVAGRSRRSAALSLDFQNGAYQVGGTSYGSLAAVPGYSYARTGVKLEANGAAAVAFAANAPGLISGLGYYSRAAATNIILQSQTFDDATWNKATIGTPAPVVTANAVAAPDGTTTAEQVVLPVVNTLGNVSALNQSVALTSGVVTTFSIWLKGNAGGEQLYLYATTNGSVFRGTVAVVLTNAWRRYTMTFTPDATTSWFIGFGTDFRDSAQGNTNGGTIFAWQANIVTASGAIAGPDAVTTTASAAVGADALSVTVPNGIYIETATFDDGSMQTRNITVSGTAYAPPVYPTVLNRPAVRSITLK